jgi:hypothetical protein
MTHFPTPFGHFEWRVDCRDPRQSARAKAILGRQKATR